MYAYCIAAAHARRPHLRLDHYMVSSPKTPGEGWPWIDVLPARFPVCASGHWDAATRLRLPVFLHYCKKYELPVVMKKKKKHEVSAAAVVTMEKKDYDGRDLMACPHEQNLERRKEGGAKTEGRDALPVVPASVENAVFPVFPRRRRGNVARHSGAHYGYVDAREESEARWQRRVEKRTTFMVCHTVRELGKARDAHRARACGRWTAASNLTTTRDFDDG